MVVSVTERDAYWPDAQAEPGAALLDPFAAALEEAGMCITVRREVTAADVAELGSSWARRLGIPGRRRAWWLAATRPRPVWE